jgi:oligopeptide/dipeptide ABC transporter ATP-binding protein
VTPILALDDLRTSFAGPDGAVPAVRGVSLEIEPGETVGIVGESGSGKSVTFLSVLRLLPAAGHVVGGRVTLDGVDLLAASQRDLRRLRGRRIGMVFQDSMTSLNPLLTIGRQITESLEAHRGLGRRDARRRAVELLAEVGVPEPERRLDQYPHQLSGGLRQRAAVAIALAPDPEVLVADEPTTALDVTIQAQLLDLLRREQRERGMALVLITHDLGVIARVADRVCVMYAGRIVEEGPVEQVFATPHHPYTVGLLASVPRLDGELVDRLPSIAGAPPQLWELPAGCPFRPRCSRAIDLCVEVDPPLEACSDDEAHRVACHSPVEGGS